MFQNWTGQAAGRVIAGARVRAGLALLVLGPLVLALLEWLPCVRRFRAGHSGNSSLHEQVNSQPWIVKPGWPDGGRYARGS